MGDSIFPCFLLLLLSSLFLTNLCLLCLFGSFIDRSSVSFLTTEKSDATLPFPEGEAGYPGVTPGVLVLFAACGSSADEQRPVPPTQ